MSDLIPAHAVGPVLAFVAFALFGGVAASFAWSPGRDAQKRLRSYGLAAAKEDRDPRGALAETELTKRAVAALTKIVRGRGVLEWVEASLDVARLPVRAAEGSFFTLAFAAAATIGLWSLKGPIVGILTGVLLVGLAAATLHISVIKSRRRFAKQLPSMLQLLASSLRAGYSLLQAWDAVAREIDGPMASELRRVLLEARIGRPMHEALDAAATRMQSADFAWVVMAIGIQREVGGNLAELLDTVGETMRARSRLRGEVKALTAEGRVSAVVLGIMPPALGVAMMMMSPGYLDPLFSEPVGQLMLGGALVAMTAGFIWMQKIIKVEL